MWAFVIYPALIVLHASPGMGLCYVIYPASIVLPTRHGGDWDQRTLSVAPEHLHHVKLLEFCHVEFVDTANEQCQSPFSVTEP